MAAYKLGKDLTPTIFPLPSSIWFVDLQELRTDGDFQIRLLSLHNVDLLIHSHLLPEEVHLMMVVHGTDL